MIDTLRRLIERLEQLPEDEQEEIARRIEAIVEDVDDRKWDELLATPESIAYLDKLAAEAKREREAGMLVDLDEALEAEE